MDINWLFAQYVMRNTIFIIKITHVIFAKCYYSLSGQYLKTGWVNRLSRPLNRFSPGGNRLNRYKNRLNRFWPPPRPCCQSAPSVSQTALSDCQKICAVNPFFCAVWPETGWTGFITGWTGFLSADRPAPPLFLSPSPLLFFSVPFSSRRRLLFFFSLLHTFSTQKPTCAIQSLEVFVRDQFISAFSIISLDLVRISWFKLRIEVLPHFISLYSILPVLDYLVYHSLGTF
jgi:hypothetical protein